MKLVPSGGRALVGTARQMSACDSELAAILDALQSYRQFLSSGVAFTIFTDHCSLKYLEQLRFKKSPKLIRYSLLMQCYNYDIVHTKGKDNKLPDFLSRYPFD
jgi:RNase H-like domain found in reverse transcriptase